MTIEQVVYINDNGDGTHGVVINGQRGPEALLRYKGETVQRVYVNGRERRPLTMAEAMQQVSYWGVRCR